MLVKTIEEKINSKSKKLINDIANYQIITLKPVEENVVR
jgi:ribosomal protein S17E